MRRSRLVRAVASEVGKDSEDSAVGVVGLREAELGEDVADVLADGCLGDDELAGDRGVGVSFGDEGQDLAFARTARTAGRGGAGPAGL